MRTVQGEGQYAVEDTGQVVTYPYEFRVFEDKADIELEVLLSLANRQEKVDCNNVAWAKARTANGHSTVRVLTPEEKEQRKAQRKEDGADLKAIKAEAKRQGLSVAELLALVAK